MQTQPQQVKADIYNYPGGSMSDRCKVIHAAYNAHDISLKDMTYALMQYYCAEVGSGRMRDDRPLPTVSSKPEKGAPPELWNKYNDEMASWHRADNQNYEAKAMIKRVEEFQLACRDDDYDYSKAKEWGAYIVTGVVDGAVRDYLGEQPPTGEPQPAAELAEQDVPF